MFYLAFHPTSHVMVPGGDHLYKLVKERPKRHCCIILLFVIEFEQLEGLFFKGFRAFENERKE